MWELVLSVLLVTSAPARGVITLNSWESVPSYGVDIRYVYGCLIETLLSGASSAVYTSKTTFVDHLALPTSYVQREYVDSKECMDHAYSSSESLDGKRLAMAYAEAQLHAEKPSLNTLEASLDKDDNGARYVYMYTTSSSPVFSTSTLVGSVPNTADNGDRALVTRTVASATLLSIEIVGFGSSYDVHVKCTSDKNGYEGGTTWYRPLHPETRPVAPAVAWSGSTASVQVQYDLPTTLTDVLPAHSDDKLLLGFDILTADGNTVTTSATFDVTDSSRVLAQLPIANSVNETTSVSIGKHLTECRALGLVPALLTPRFARAFEVITYFDGNLGTRTSTWYNSAADTTVSAFSFPCVPSSVVKDTDWSIACDTEVGGACVPTLLNSDFIALDAASNQWTFTFQFACSGYSTISGISSGGHVLLPGDVSCTVSMVAEGPSTNILMSAGTVSVSSFSTTILTRSTWGARHDAFNGVLYANVPTFLDEASAQVQYQIRVEHLGSQLSNCGVDAAIVSSDEIALPLSSDCPILFGSAHVSVDVCVQANPGTSDIGLGVFDAACTTVEILDMSNAPVVDTWTSAWGLQYKISQGCLYESDNPTTVQSFNTAGNCLSTSGTANRVAAFLAGEALLGETSAQPDEQVRYVQFNMSASVADDVVMSINVHSFTSAFVASLLDNNTSVAPHTSVRVVAAVPTDAFMLGVEYSVPYVPSATATTGTGCDFYKYAWPSATHCYDASTSWAKPLMLEVRPETPSISFDALQAQWIDVQYASTSLPTELQDYTVTLTNDTIDVSFDAVNASGTTTSTAMLTSQGSLSLDALLTLCRSFSEMDNTLVQPSIERTFTAPYYTPSTITAGAVASSDAAFPCMSALLHNGTDLSVQCDAYACTVAPLGNVSSLVSMLDNTLWALQLEVAGSVQTKTYSYSSRLLLPVDTYTVTAKTIFNSSFSLSSTLMFGGSPTFSVSDNFPAMTLSAYHNDTANSLVVEGLPVLNDEYSINIPYTVWVEQAGTNVTGCTWTQTLPLELSLSVCVGLTYDAVATLKARAVPLNSQFGDVYPVVQTDVLLLAQTSVPVSQVWNTAASWNVQYRLVPGCVVTVDGTRSMMDASACYNNAFTGSNNVTFEALYAATELRREHVHDIDSSVSSNVSSSSTEFSLLAFDLNGTSNYTLAATSEQVVELWPSTTVSQFDLLRLRIAESYGVAFSAGLGCVLVLSDNTTTCYDVSFGAYAAPLRFELRPLAPVVLASNASISLQTTVPALPEAVSASSVPLDNECSVICFDTLNASDLSVVSSGTCTQNSANVGELVSVEEMMIACRADAHQNKIVRPRFARIFSTFVEGSSTWNSVSELSAVVADTYFPCLSETVPNSTLVSVTCDAFAFCQVILLNNALVPNNSAWSLSVRVTSGSDTRAYQPTSKILLPVGSATMQLVAHNTITLVDIVSLMDNVTVENNFDVSPSAYHNATSATLVLENLPELTDEASAAILYTVWLQQGGLNVTACTWTQTPPFVLSLASCVGLTYDTVATVRARAMPSNSQFGDVYPTVETEIVLLSPSSVVLDSWVLMPTWNVLYRLVSGCYDSNTPTQECFPSESNDIVALFAVSELRRHHIDSIDLQGQVFMEAYDVAGTGTFNSSNGHLELWPSTQISHWDIASVHTNSSTCSMTVNNVGTPITCNDTNVSPYVTPLRMEVEPLIPTVSVSADGSMSLSMPTVSVPSHVYLPPYTDTVELCLDTDIACEATSSSVSFDSVLEWCRRHVHNAPVYPRFRRVFQTGSKNFSGALTSTSDSYELPCFASHLSSSETAIVCDPVFGGICDVSIYLATSWSTKLRVHMDNDTQTAAVNTTLVLPAGTNTIELVTYETDKEVVSLVETVTVLTVTSLPSAQHDFELDTLNITVLPLTIGGTAVPYDIRIEQSTGVVCSLNATTNQTILLPLALCPAIDRSDPVSVYAAPRVTALNGAPYPALEAHNVTVKHLYAPLALVVEGGTNRTLPHGGALVLDISYSHDVVNTSNTDRFDLTLVCTANATQIPCNFVDFISKLPSRFSVAIAADALIGPSLYTLQITVTDSQREVPTSSMTVSLLVLKPVQAPVVYVAAAIASGTTGTDSHVIPAVLDNEYIRIEGSAALSVNGQPAVAADDETLALHNATLVWTSNSVNLSEASETMATMRALTLRMEALPQNVPLEVELQAHVLFYGEWTLSSSVTVQFEVRSSGNVTINVSNDTSSLLLHYLFHQAAQTVSIDRKSKRKILASCSGVPSQVSRVQMRYVSVIDGLVLPITEWQQQTFPRGQQKLSLPSFDTTLLPNGVMRIYVELMDDRGGGSVSAPLDLSIFDDVATWDTKCQAYLDDLASVTATDVRELHAAWRVARSLAYDADGAEATDATAGDLTQSQTCRRLYRRLQWRLLRVQASVGAFTRGNRHSSEGYAIESDDSLEQVLQLGSDTASSVAALGFGSTSTTKATASYSTTTAPTTHDDVSDAEDESIETVGAFVGAVKRLARPSRNLVRNVASGLGQVLHGSRRRYTRRRASLLQESPTTFGEEVRHCILMNWALKQAQHLLKAQARDMLGGEQIDLHEIYGMNLSVVNGDTPTQLQAARVQVYDILRSNQSGTTPTSVYNGTASSTGLGRSTLSLRVVQLSPELFKETTNCLAGHRPRTVDRMVPQRACGIVSIESDSTVKDVSLDPCAAGPVSDTAEDVECVFWTGTIWSTEGCVTERSASGVLQCRCSHLTTFAVARRLVAEVQNAMLNGTESRMSILQSMHALPQEAKLPLFVIGGFYGAIFLVGIVITVPLALSLRSRQSRLSGSGTSMSLLSASTKSLVKRVSRRTRRRAFLLSGVTTLLAGMRTGSTLVLALSLGEDGVPSDIVSQIVGLVVSALPDALKYWALSWVVIEWAAICHFCMRHSANPTRPLQRVFLGANSSVSLIISGIMIAAAALLLSDSTYQQLSVVISLLNIGSILLCLASAATCAAFLLYGSLLARKLWREHRRQYANPQPVVHMLLMKRPEDENSDMDPAKKKLLEALIGAASRVRRFVLTPMQARTWARLRGSIFRLFGISSVVATLMLLNASITLFALMAKEISERTLMHVFLVSLSLDAMLFAFFLVLQSKTLRAHQAATRAYRSTMSESNSTSTGDKTSIPTHDDLIAKKARALRQEQVRQAKRARRRVQVNLKLKAATTQEHPPRQD
ncbi:MAG: hypothetical protein MHM6MM_002728 [Cercozoa sp. M6MM]